MQAQIKESMDSTWSELGADSLDTVELLMAVEEELGMEFDDEEAAAADTPNKSVALICKKLNIKE